MHHALCNAAFDAGNHILDPANMPSYFGEYTFSMGGPIIV